MDHTRKYSSAKRLASRIALMGGNRVNGAWEAPWRPSCDNPVEVRVSSPRTDRGRWTTATLRPYDVLMLVPCRKCEQCLRIRQMQWRTRILRELDRAVYAYFITLTFSPAHMAGVLAEAQQRRQQGRTAVEGAAYRHVALYLKRLRKGRTASSRGAAKDSLGRTRQRFDGISLRFFAAMEYGEENGRLHFHLLVHTQRYVPPEIFTGEWRSRADAQLVRSREGCATYVSKYLTKEQTPGRARASIKYGLEENKPNPVSTTHQVASSENSQQDGGEGEHRNGNAGSSPCVLGASRGYTPPAALVSVET